MIGIIDYGMGNLFSVEKALERLGVEAFISDDHERLRQADGLILPGVGAFKDAMDLLNENGLTKMIHEYVQTGKPFLGICLGMQLLFESSEENGLTNGLSLLPGKVIRFSGVDRKGESYKVPHMGWNKLRFDQDSPLLQGVDEDYVYFVHSFYVDADQSDVVLAEANYDVNVAAVVGMENVFGMQFHPEKSSVMGMQLLRNFTKLTEKGSTADEFYNLSRN
ncbi:imidazole glycerol phosphate synthase subunit HisH [Cytobacillus gottheilii]|uniref:imidazole glycerol phosphate synthase subunit HisH n=1 Tax=Cytobacillus gottheilii TaxID=859144 RepID=UPI003CF707BF